MVVEFYGVLQQVAGTRSMELETPQSEQLTVGQALELLHERVPGLSEHLPRVACAQAENLVRRDQIVDTHRPLVLLPPVSGGWRGGNGLDD
ncbi:MAG: MoaD/ThiS family protein [Ectothiorhodospiraceae bacterium]|nr:MoaD/ThiS family protein [Ectothiorhodospiraceae bacterium]